MLSGKKVLITGGTGSFGTTFVERFVDSDIENIVIFSRDEKKQHDMRLRFRSPKLRFVIGDIRDRRVIEDASYGIDYIFHAAALKQVPACDFAPVEAVKTNVLGTDNLIHAAVAQGVSKVVFLSTGKAVHPINAMGISKAMMEKVIIQRARELIENGVDTTLSFIRYSNVFGSRGSAISMFIEQIRKGEAVTLTHPGMVRSFMSVDEALDLALFALTHADNGDLFIYKSKRATLEFVAKTMQELMNATNRQIRIIGKRHGEKLEETILSPEERIRMVDMGDYCRVPLDRRGLNYHCGIEENRRDCIYSDSEPKKVQMPSLTKTHLHYLLEHYTDVFAGEGVEVRDSGRITRLYRSH